MNDYYITFGQNHAHSYGGETLDKDCVAKVKGDGAGEVHDWAMKTFDAKFFSVYEKIPEMKYFPRGIIFLRR